MNLYTTTDGYASLIDLDNLNIYSQEWKDMPIQDLFYLAWGKAGRSLFYMTYFWPDEKGDLQWCRVNDLCKELVGWNGKKRYTEDDRLELMSWLYRFEDEVENQC